MNVDAAKHIDYAGNWFVEHLRSSGTNGFVEHVRSSGTNERAIQMNVDDKAQRFKTSEVKVMNESHNELLQSLFVFLSNVEWTMVAWLKLKS